MILRFVRPGYPVDPSLFLDLGPARGRVTGNQNRLDAMRSIGGPIETQATAWAGKRIRQEQEHRPRLTERCLAVMRTGGTCMSMAGHSDHHRARP